MQAVQFSPRPCAICHKSLTVNARTHTCGTPFHPGCIKQWPRCPACHKPFKVDVSEMSKSSPATVTTPRRPTLRRCQSFGIPRPLNDDLLEYITRIGKTSKSMGVLHVLQFFEEYPQWKNFQDKVDGIMSYLAAS